MFGLRPLDLATLVVYLPGICYAWLPLFCTPFYWIMMPLFRRMRYITS